MTTCSTMVVKKKISSNSPGAYAGLQARGLTHRPRALSSGFTLVEIILVISILLVFVSLMAVTLGGGQAKAYLDEGTQRFATLMEMCRAEAANTGRRFRINFQIESEDEDTPEDQQEGAFEIQWEPQPLAQPGVFSKYTDQSWATDLPTSYLAVVSCRLTGDSAYKTLVYNNEDSEDSDGNERSPITFNSDGTSDSATILLQSRDNSDPRVARIDLNGLNRMTSIRFFDDTESYEEAVEEAADEAGQ